MGRLFIGLFAAVTMIVSPVLAQNGAATATSTSVETVLVVAEKIAANRLTQAQAAQLLGNAESAASLFGRVKTPQTNPATPSGTLRARRMASLSDIGAPGDYATRHACLFHRLPTGQALH